MHYKFSILLLSFLFPALLSGQQFDDWLVENAISLPLPQPTFELDNLDALGSSMGNAEVIALGDATHGTREFNQMKFHLVRFAVERLGIRLFILEEGFTHCLSVNQYLQTGIGTAEEALDRLSGWVWKTEQMRNLVKWMRRWNIRHPDDPIAFYGMDMQSFKSPALLLVNFSVKYAPDLYKNHFELLDKILSHPSDQLPPKLARSLADLTQGLISDLRVGAYEMDRLGGTDRNQLQMAAITLYQAIELNYADRTSYRNHSMFLNVNSLRKMRGRKEKAILWTHNAHITRTPAEDGVLSMGSYLAMKYGRSYFALGFDFGEGDFMTVDRPKGKPVTVSLNWQTRKPNPYWSALADQESPVTFMDLRRARQVPKVKRFLEKYSQVRCIGNTLSEKDSEDHFQGDSVTEKDQKMLLDRSPVHENYDGIFWFTRTTPSRSMDPSP